MENRDVVNTILNHIPWKVTGISDLCGVFLSVLRIRAVSQKFLRVVSGFDRRDSRLAYEFYMLRHEVIDTMIVSVILALAIAHLNRHRKASL